VLRGEFVTLLGPSGGGKTSTLRMIAGFIRPDAGHISLRGERVNDVPPYERDIGMVFQSYALFPHMTARDNVAFGSGCGAWTAGRRPSGRRGARPRPARGLCRPLPPPALGGSSSGSPSRGLS